MEKRQEAAVLVYFSLLLLLVLTGMIAEFNLINLGYLVVVVCSIIKFILIVNKDKK